MAVIKTTDKARIFNIKAPVLPVNPQTGLTDVWDNLKQMYPGILVPNEAE